MFQLTVLVVVQPNCYIIDKLSLILASQLSFVEVLIWTQYPCKEYLSSIPEWAVYYNY